MLAGQHVSKPSASATERAAIVRAGLPVSRVTDWQQILLANIRRCAVWLLA
jgi:hypothetical protein